MGGKTTSARATDVGHGKRQAGARKALCHGAKRAGWTIDVPNVLAQANAHQGL